MNILLLSTHLNIGGIASYIVSLARHLKKRGRNVVVSSSGGVMVDELARDGIPHVYLNVRTKSELSPRLLFALPKLLSLIEKNDIRVIHAHTRVTQVLACVASRLTGVPYVTTCHGFFKRRMARRIFKCWGDKTIAISDAVKSHLIDDFNINPDDIALIYNGVEVERFNKEFSREERDSLKKALNLKSPTVIGGIGRLSPVKGYRYLIEAFKILLDEYKDLDLLIVGDGPEKDELKGIAKRLDIEGHVTFAKPRLDTPRLLSVMDIFVSSAVQEGLGLSLAESLASKRPVVATDVGGVSSLVKDKETGLLVKPKEPKALAKAISVLLRDPALRERLTSNGRRLVEKDFSINAMVDKIEDVYKVSRSKVSRSDLDTRGKSKFIVSRSDLDTMERILIVNVNWLGDVLFTTPFIKAIRRRFPRSYMACMVVPRCKELLEDNPNVDEIIIYDEDGEHKGIIGKIKLVMSLRRKRFDASFILHRSLTRALMVYLSGIKMRIGYDTKHRGFLLTRRIEGDNLGAHKVEYFLNIAKGCGAETGDKDYEFFVKNSDRELMDEFLKEKGVEKEDVLVVLNPGGNWPPKRWPKENFAELSDRLSNELNAKIVITGALKDSGLTREISNLSKVRLIDASGSTSLKTLAALMKRADLVVSSDSGPMHLALSVKTRVIALFGPTSDLLTGPYGSGGYAIIKKDVNCPVPCYNFTCRDYRCMKAITVDEVFNKAKEMLEKSKLKTQNYNLKLKTFD